MVDDETIIRAVLGGDVEAFGELVERWGPALVRMVRNMTGDGGNCEDIAQDCFLTAYKKLGSFDASRSRFSTWLFTIGRNKSINAMRKRRPRVTAETPEAVCQRGPADELGRQEFFDELDRQLGRLSGKLRRAFVLAEFEKLSYDEIAQIERTKVGTVKSRISRAKDKLRAALAGFDGEMV